MRVKIEVEKGCSGEFKCHGIAPLLNGEQGEVVRVGEAPLGQEHTVTVYLFRYGHHSYFMPSELRNLDGSVWEVE